MLSPAEVVADVAGALELLPALLHDRLLRPTEAHAAVVAPDITLAADPLTASRYGFVGGNPATRNEFDGHTQGCTFHGDPTGCGNHAPGEELAPGNPFDAALNTLRDVYNTGGTHQHGPSSPNSTPPGSTVAGPAGGLGFGGSAIGTVAAPPPPTANPAAALLSGFKSGLSGLAGGAKAVGGAAVDVTKAATGAIVDFGVGFGEGGFGAIKGLGSLALTGGHILWDVAGLAFDYENTQHYFDDLTKRSSKLLNGIVGIPAAIAHMCDGKNAARCIGFGSFQVAALIATAGSSESAEAGLFASRTAGEGDALGVAGRGRANVCRSFGGDTLITMADGTFKPIREVEVGDYVIAIDPRTGKRYKKRVNVVWQHHDQLYLLDVAGTPIQTTATHRFWDQTQQRWTQAGYLPANDKVLSATLGPVGTGGLDSFSRTEGIGYDLSVDGVHSYLVGSSAVLVHNCPPEAIGPMAGRKIGHTFKDHGSDATNQILNRAAGGNMEVGQFIDDAAAEQFIANNLDKLQHGAITLDLPAGIGRIVGPDGSFTPATKVRLVPSGSGVKTAYPVR